MASEITQTLPVKGMQCASCASMIKRTLSKVEGVEKVDCYFGTEEAVITYREDKTTIPAMNQQLRPLGYQLMTDHTDHTDHAAQHEHNHASIPDDQEVARERNQALFGLPIALLIFAAMLWEIVAVQVPQVPMLPIPEPVWLTIQFFLATAMLLGIGQIFLQAIWLFIRYRKANMDTLVGIGTAAAYIYSSIGLFFPSLLQRWQLPATLYFDVVIVVIGFVKFGKFLEANSKRKTGEALRSLLQLQVKTALVKKDNTFVEVPVEALQVGDLIQIKPGSQVPIDGLVTEGSSNLNESMITGEPLPVAKKVGDTVIGGTLNTDGALLIKVTKVAAETVLAQIIGMVKDAQNSKAPIERLADQVSAVFVPIVLVIAVLTLASWVVIGSNFMPATQALAFGLSCMIAVLVIACPCALGLATPTAVIAGVGQAAKRGILIKNAESLEQLHKVTTVVFDKTGTLTTGQPTVQRIVTFGSKSEASLLQIAASLETHSEHPLAQAVIQRAEQDKIKTRPVTDFKNLEGEGVTAVLSKQQYWLVGESGVLNRGLAIPENFQGIPGESLLFVLNDKQILGVMTVTDVLKDSAREAVTQLKKLHLKLVMLSGDRQATASHLAEQLQIDRAIGGVKPDQKLDYITALQKEGEVVAMVGDGVNDAPALATADVGIAMSTGTDVAISTAQATILKGDLLKVVTAISLSKVTMRTIKENLFWAFGYNVLGIPLAAGVLFPITGWLLNPAFAGFAMAFSSVSVVLNSLRLRLYKE